ncbi:hypothetical protein ACHAQH_004468 [Verticillium albo-atrum]
MAESTEKLRWGGWFGRKSKSAQTQETQEKQGPPRWSMGVLNDPHTVQVPGSVLLLASNRNEPLGLRNAPARTSHSSIPTGFFDPDSTPPATARRSSSHGPAVDETKKTKDGKIILEPQPEDSANDPLNWPAWRRDTALFSLGFYCLIGGGITPLLAAGFYDVADEYKVSVEDVSLTTGLYMMGMGLGSVVASPTAILWGKRPVYLASAILLVVSSIWCALSPNFASLIVARIVQGIAVSPVECLPSATIAEIFFLHERAYRIGIYTLLLLGGKNLVPLVSAVIMQSLDWRWVFWWLKVMIRPFILFAYPSVLWSTVIYSCSVGWLIVISETMSMIYRTSDSYNFTALQTGLVYISPFVGGILGTAVAGKVSDIIVRAMARRNGGLYEPEFRLVMAIPILISTVIGLMGFGWSAEERDHWMVPTVFFGVVSFGCSMGSTTSITYCVDSYRQYAGEALVTLNFSKNILHGLVFSLFVTHWMASDGPKTMFIWLGVIQLIFCLFSIPMFIFGKRARMWTVRKNFMEKF